MNTQMQMLSDTKEELGNLGDVGLVMDQTIECWVGYGILWMLETLIFQGVELPSKTVEKYLTEARELINTCEGK